MQGCQQDGISGLGQTDGGGVPGESDHQLGRDPLGEPLDGAVGGATGAGPHFTHRVAADCLSRVQGELACSHVTRRTYVHTYIHTYTHLQMHTH